MPKKKQPFLYNEDGHGMSRTTFRRMGKAEKIELMAVWFLSNYEDPAERTPFESAEGGYQWIWGGPYDASEEMSEKFEGIVPNAWIEQAVEEVESDGLTVWAPKRKPEDYDDSWNDEPSELPSLEFYTDVPSETYGSPAERTARSKAKEAIDELRWLLERPAGIGHNRPPDKETTEPEEIEQLRPALAELSSELAAPEPSIPLVKQWAAPLRAALVAGIKWVGRKVDKAVDAAMTTIGKTAGAAIAGSAAVHLDPALNRAFHAVISWLELAAKTLF